MKLKQITPNSKKGATSIVLIALVAVILILGGGWFLSSNSGNGVVGGGGNDDDNNNNDIVDCQIAPSLNPIVNDQINPGTTVTSGMQVIKGTSYLGTKTSSDTFSQGDSLEVLINGTNYISKKVNVGPLNCGPNDVVADLLKLDGTPTVEVYDNSNNQLTDNAAGGAQNQSAKATTITNRILVTLPADEGTDKMYFVVEGANSTQINELTMSVSSGGVKVEEFEDNKPQFHKAESTGNDEIIRTFVVSDITPDGSTFELNLVTTPESGQTVGTGGTAMYLTWYVPDTAVDDDGKFITDIQDKSGDAIHVTGASSDYDWLAV